MCRYHLQYWKGMKHGFEVYDLYSGDSCVGEWLNGLSHGVESGAVKGLS